MYDTDKTWRGNQPALSHALALNISYVVQQSVLFLDPPLVLFKLFGWGFIQGESLFDGVPIKLFDICRRKGSLSKLLFSIILKEQSNMEY